MQSRWIWVLLVLAVAGVVLARNVGKKKAVVAEQDQALPLLVDLGAGKCEACKRMTPILEELQETHASAFRTRFIDVWEQREEGEKFAIRMIPTQIFFDAGGKELFRHEGFFSKEDILAKWRELGVELPAVQAAVLAVPGNG